MWKLISRICSFLELWHTIVHYTKYIQIMMRSPSLSLCFLLLVVIFGSSALEWSLHMQTSSSPPSLRNGKEISMALRGDMPGCASTAELSGCSRAGSTKLYSPAVCWKVRWRLNPSVHMHTQLYWHRGKLFGPIESPLHFGSKSADCTSGCVCTRLSPVDLYVYYRLQTTES